MDKELYIKCNPSTLLVSIFYMLFLLILFLREQLGRILNSQHLKHDLLFFHSLQRVRLLDFHHSYMQLMPQNMPLACSLCHSHFFPKAHKHQNQPAAFFAFGWILSLCAVFALTLNLYNLFIHKSLEFRYKINFYKFPAIDKPLYIQEV